MTRTPRVIPTNDSTQQRKGAHTVRRRLGIVIFAGVFFVAQTASRAQDASRPLSAPTRPASVSPGAQLSKPTPPSPNRAPIVRKPAPGAAVARTAQSTTVANTPASKTITSSVKLDGLEYIELPAFAKTLGCTVSWKKTAEQLVIGKGALRIEVTGDSREFYVNGARVFAGSAVRIRNRSLWISRIDADKLFAPIIDPALGRGSVVPLKIIAIDAGHGGIDKGMINERLKAYEKTLNLDTAKRLKTILEKRGYKVVMTRTGDKKIDLGNRPEIAARAGADLFVSIHYNSVEAGAQAVSGAEVYRFTPRFQIPLRRAKSIPEDALENPGDAHAFWSSVAALKIHQALLANLKVSDRGLKHDNLAVLRLAKSPAVLVEAGFLSNDMEARKITTPAYRQQIAEAIADGINAYAAAVAAASR